MRCRQRMSVRQKKALRMNHAARMAEKIPRMIRSSSDIGRAQRKGTRSSESTCRPGAKQAAADTAELRPGRIGDVAVIAEAAFSCPCGDNPYIRASHREAVPDPAQGRRAAAH